MDDDADRAHQYAARDLARARDLLPAGARAAVQAVPAVLEDAETAAAGASARTCSPSVHEEVRAIEARIAALERELRALADADPVVTRLRTIPGIGLLTATALVGTVGHIHAFRRARQFASWLGLTPREHSSGARRRLGGISKRGDVYLRCLLTHGARAVLLAAHRRRRAGQPLTRLHQWALTRPRATRPQQSHDRGRQQTGPDRLGGLAQGCPVRGSPTAALTDAVTRPVHPRC